MVIDHSLIDIGAGGDPAGGDRRVALFQHDLLRRVENGLASPQAFGAARATRFHQFLSDAETAVTGRSRSLARALSRARRDYRVPTAHRVRGRTVTPCTRSVA
ncbi:hypothetical protein GCM10010468_23710 [Actinocorallia longicatena]|uniref:Uncharacterized protein n=1 Tax=Actinocorallia longicatena TaxID=111803 RepID=A0ABP6Q8E7_9ACTN